MTGTELKNARRAAGLTQAALAAKIGRSVSLISRMEIGLTKVSDYVAAAAAPAKRDNVTIDQKRERFARNLAMMILHGDANDYELLMRRDGGTLYGIPGSQLEAFREDVFRMIRAARKGCAPWPQRGDRAYSVVNRGADGTPPSNF